LGAYRFKSGPRSFTVTKKTDRASNALFTAALSGRRFGTVVVWSPYGSGALQTTFSLAIISSFSTNQDVESITFDCETMSSKLEDE
jgi:hypothetical protein